MRNGPSTSLYGVGSHNRLGAGRVWEGIEGDAAWPAAQAGAGAQEDERMSDNPRFDGGEPKPAQGPPTGYTSGSGVSPSALQVGSGDVGAMAGALWQKWMAVLSRPGVAVFAAEVRNASWPAIWQLLATLGAGRRSAERWRGPEYNSAIDSLRQSYYNIGTAWCCEMGVV